MKRIGIIGAMEEEVAILQSEMQETAVEHKGGLAFHVGSWQGKEIVAVRCGIGKVNAALCAQILADCYDVGLLINTGVAGGLAQELEVGDIVVSTEALQHDMDATGFGYELGVIPRMECSCFPAQKELVELALEVCREVNPGIQAAAGRVLSGDQFISSEEKKQWLADTFGGACAEMEGAAIAQAAYQNKIPYVILRGISDKAGADAEVTYEEFVEKAVIHITNVVRGIVGKL